MIRSGLIVIALVCVAVPALRAQREILPPETPLQQLALALRKIGKEGRLLEVTAHPDDEDNALLAYFGHGKGYRCTLLTLTRGEGGQNKIGPELDEDLAVLRMAELREAHRYDGAGQRFSRAIDFGYSFSEEETFAKWGREEILRDLVQVVREVRPHVILTMPFKAEGGGRHHQASAILAREAFDVAATDRWPELGAPWAADRIFERVWYAGGAASKPVDFVELFDVPIQDYDPVLGATYAEIGFKARSMHRCQGTPRFEDPKAPPRRSRWRLAAWRGDKPAPEAGLFGGLAVESPTLRAPAADPTNPDLVRAELIKLLPPDSWTPIDPALETALALSWPISVDARSTRATINSDVKTTIQVWIRNSGREPVCLKDLALEAKWHRGQPPARIAVEGRELRPGEAALVPIVVAVPEDAEANTTVSLVRTNDTERYVVATDRIPAVSILAATAMIECGSRQVRLWPSPVQHLPARELTRGQLISRRRSANFSNDLTSGSPDDPARFLRPVGVPLLPLLTAREVSYPHIAPAFLEWEFFESPPRVLRPSTTGAAGAGRPAAPCRVQVFEPGSGFRGGELPRLLAQIPEVQVVARDEPYGDTGNVDAILIGPRAVADLIEYPDGVRPEPKRREENPPRSLRDYVLEGGHIIVLYQKPEDFNRGEKFDEPGKWAPFPAKVGRNRTTDESGPVTINVPDHPFFNVPNRITEEDWKGWVQDRGLYYLETSAPEYEDLLTLEDPFPANAGKKGGALVTARVGKGRWTYVGLALTRQLRAGVPGAWRLLVNLLSAPD